MAVKFGVISMEKILKLYTQNSVDMYLVWTGRSNSNGSGNAIVPLSAITTCNALLLCKWGDQHCAPLTKLRSRVCLFEAPDPSMCFVGSVMRISTLSTFIVHKNTCNCVTELEMVNSVSVEQAYLLLALPISIDKVCGHTDLCVYKQNFLGDLTLLFWLDF